MAYLSQTKRSLAGESRGVKVDIELKMSTKGSLPLALSHAILCLPCLPKNLPFRPRFHPTRSKQSGECLVVS